MIAAPVNVSFKDRDIALWQEYRRRPTSAGREKLLEAFSGIINAQVNKWAGPVPRDVLLNEAKMLAAKAFDTYRPEAGAALATHVTNSLLPLSRIVYTYQNTARMPENLVMRVNTLNAATENLKAVHGREPTPQELHDELGWSVREIGRIRDYDRKNLTESGPAVSGTFHARSRDDDDNVFLGELMHELDPEERRLFEMVSGMNGGRPMTNPEIMRKLNITQSQLSYRKTVLTKKIDAIARKHGGFGR